MEWKKEVSVYLALIGVLILGTSVLAVYMFLSLYPLYMIVPLILGTLLYGVLWHFLYKSRNSEE